MFEENTCLNCIYDCKSLGHPICDHCLEVTFCHHPDSKSDEFWEAIDDDATIPCPHKIEMPMLDPNNPNNL